MGFGTFAEVVRCEGREDEMLTHTETLTHSTATSQKALSLDPEAFSALIERYKDQIVNYLIRLTGERDRAEDVAQETFVRFYQNHHRYREEGHLTAYLFRIATNLVRSEERRKKRWRILEPIFSRGGSSADGVHTLEHQREPDPQRSLLASEEQRKVVQAIADLDLSFRAPLVLREIEGLSYREIAEILDLNEGTVKSRLFRARDLLKKKLEPYWKGESHDSGQ